jgi:hypothetical protein
VEGVEVADGSGAKPFGRVRVARLRRLGYWSRRSASPLLRPDHRHSLTRGRPASSSCATRAVPGAARGNSRTRKAGQAGSSVRPGTACSSAFPGPPSVSRRDPRRRGTAMSVRQALTVCRLGLALALAATSCRGRHPGRGALPPGQSAAWIPDNHRYLQPLELC